eukprot:GHVQ01008474.1.p1 GENE.GHVQ01008474.1~~GHVQ01008474.1.p1  ORF type:complete len:295 (-),score=29.18 GHVQ01008474.1:1794-2678(-)
MDESSPEAWYRGLPPVTKWIVTATFISTLLVVLGVMSPSILIFDMRLIFYRLHLWRIISNYLFLGKFSFGWLLHMYLFCQFSGKLEKSGIFETYASGYLYFMLFQMVTLDLFSVVLYYPSGMPSLASALVFAILYYWSRREPYAQVGMWGFTVEAYKFPFCLMLLDVMMGNSVMYDILGLLSGHLYYFLRELAPSAGGYNLLEAPPVLLDTLMNKLLSLTGGSSGANRSTSGYTRPTGESRSAWGGATTSTMGGEGSGGGGSTGGMRFWGSTQPTQRNREFDGPGHRLGGGGAD